MLFPEAKIQRLAWLHTISYNCLRYKTTDERPCQVISRAAWTQLVHTSKFPQLTRLVLVREKLAKVSRKHNRIKVKLVEGSLLFVPTSKFQSIDEYSLLIFLAQQLFCNFLHKGTCHGKI